MKTISFLLLALACAPSSAQVENAHFDAEVSPNLRLRGGGRSHVYAWAKLDDKLEGWFLIDTGAKSNHLTKEAAKRLGLELKPDGRVGGVGASVKAYRCQATKLQLGPLTLDAPRFTVADVKAKLSSFRLGTLGSDMFKASVVVYDAAKPSVALYDPKTFEPPPVEWDKCILLDARPFARMKIEDKPVLLEIDTGGGESVLLCTPAVKRLGLSDGRPTKKKLIYGPFGSVATLTTKLESFEIGVTGFGNLTATLGLQNKGWLGSTHHDGLIGAPILCHMVVIFDYSRKRISFTQRPLFKLLTNAVKPTGFPVFTAMQATGAPDAEDRLTYGNAWFPSDSHGRHWLELTFAAPVEAKRLEVWGTSGQGGVTAVHTKTKAGTKVPITWSGRVEKSLADGLALTSGAVEVDEPVDTIRLEIDCSRIRGTNVVDAVGLVDADGKTHWAEMARADGSRNGTTRRGFDTGSVLERHAARLTQRGQDREAARVRKRIELDKKAKKASKIP